MSEVILDIRNMNVALGPHLAVKDVNYQIHAGERGRLNIKDTAPVLFSSV